MRRLIYQVDIQIRGADPLYEFCKASVKRYAEKIGADYYVLSEPKIKIGPDWSRSNRNKNGLIKEAGGYMVILEKENAFDRLDEYDQICVIDADIYIKEHAPNIFEQLTDEYDWGGVLERSMPLTGSHRAKIQGYSKDMFTNLKDVDWNWNKDGAEFMNMGVMLFDKSIKNYLKGQTAKQFLLRPEFKDMIDGVNYLRFSTDQVLLNYWLKRDKVRVNHMNWKWNGMYRGVVDEKIKDAYFIHFFLKNQIPQGGKNIDMLKKIVGE
jgi:hypothetical protein